MLYKDVAGIPSQTTFISTFSCQKSSLKIKNTSPIIDNVLSIILLMHIDTSAFFYYCIDTNKPHTIYSDLYLGLSQ